MSLPNTEPFTPTSARRLTNPIALIVLVSFMYAIGVLLGQLAVVPLLSLKPSQGDGTAVLLALKIPMTVLGHAPIFLLLALWLRYYEKRPYQTFFSSMGLTRHRWRHHALGFGIAIAVMGTWMAYSMAAGQMTLDEWLPSAGMPTALLMVLIPMFYLNRLIMIAVEEVLFRGWTLQVVSARWGTIAGIAVSAGSFALFHFANPLNLLMSTHRLSWVTALNLILWSVLACLLTLVTRTLWAAMAFHAGSLFLTDEGFTVLTDPSQQTEPSLALLLQRSTDLFSGDITEMAGPYTGLIVAVPLALGCVVMAFVVRRRLKNADDSPDRQVPSSVEC